MIAEATREGKALAAATSAKDFAKIADATYPQALEQLGGREKAIEMMAKAFESPKFHLKSTTVNTASLLVDTGQRAYCILPETTEIGVPAGTATQQSFILGISDDRGSHWSFIDGAAGETTIHKLLPDLPDTVKLPPRPKLIVSADVPAPPARGFMATAVPDDVTSLQSSTEKWLAHFKGKSQADVTQELGGDFKKGQWQSGETSGVKLKYNVGLHGELTLMLYHDRVGTVYFDVDPDN
jgi:hypothetical protein